MIHRMFASSPDYPAFDALWTLNAWVVNRHMHTCRILQELPEPEYRALRARIDDAMAALLNDVPASVAAMIERLEDVRQ